MQQLKLMGIEPNTIEESHANHPDGVQGCIEFEFSAFAHTMFDLVNELIAAGLLPSAGIDPTAYRIRVRIDYMADPDEVFA